MKVFTVESGRVSPGAVVTKRSIAGGKIEIDVVEVGEEGRGRKLAFLPVQGYIEEDENGNRYIFNTVVGQTRSGHSKLITSEDADDERCIIVFRTKIGFRGGNRHTGDRSAEHWTLEYFFHSDAEEVGVPVQDRYTADEVDEYLPKLLEVEPHARFSIHLEFAPFPGEVLAEGTIAQGDAGRMGSGSQLIAVIPKDTVFRTGYSGRLYGAPSAHYYLFDGQDVLAVTWDERAATDIF